MTDADAEIAALRASVEALEAKEAKWIDAGEVIVHRPSSVAGTVAPALRNMPSVEPGRYRVLLEKKP